MKADLISQLYTPSASSNFRMSSNSISQAYSSNYIRENMVNPHFQKANQKSLVHRAYVPLSPCGNIKNG